MAGGGPAVRGARGGKRGGMVGAEGAALPSVCGRCGPGAAGPVRRKVGACGFSRFLGVFWDALAL